jgi:hypothetical protein
MDCPALAAPQWCGFYACPLCTEGDFAMFSRHQAIKRIFT